MKETTLTPILVFNGVMFLGGFSVQYQTVNTNSKYKQ